MIEPVVITDMRIVAKASIVVYHNTATNEFFIDPLLPENPLFKLGNFKGDTGAQGAQGAQGAKGDTGAQGAQGAQGVVDPLVIQAAQDATTNANNAAANATSQTLQAVTNASVATAAANTAAQQAPKAYILAGGTLNVQRAGIVNGLEIQTVNSSWALLGRVVIFRGLLKLVSSATGTGSMQINIGGLIFTFPTLAIAVGTQYVNFEVTAHVISSAVGFASVRQSIALNGVAANPVQSNNLAQSGSQVTNTALIQFKSPVTSQVTTLLAMTEIL